MATDQKLITHDEFLNIQKQINIIEYLFENKFEEQTLVYLLDKIPIKYIVMTQKLSSVFLEKYIYNRLTDDDFDDQLSVEDVINYQKKTFLVK